jgi:hypothetical protein
MTPMRTVSAAVLLAAISIYPVAALAATNAKLVTALPDDAMPVAELVSSVGMWAPSDLAVVDKAAAIKVLDTRTLYKGDDLQKIASAETGKATQLSKFHDAIRADANLNGWLAANKIDPAKVIAISDPKGTPEIFVY